MPHNTTLSNHSLFFAVLCCAVPCCAANERTFLSWCSMATTMGGVSSAMVGLSISTSGSSEGRLISKKTVDLVSAVYVPVAIIMICYALFTYEWRSKFMHKKQVGLQSQHCCWPGPAWFQNIGSTAGMWTCQFLRQCHSVIHPIVAAHSQLPAASHYKGDWVNASFNRSPEPAYLASVLCSGCQHRHPTAAADNQQRPIAGALHRPRQITPLLSPLLADFYVVVSCPPCCAAVPCCLLLPPTVPCCCQVGFFDDKVGPITLACIVMITLVAITIMAFIDVLS
jgi:uncharacterized membrane protein YidH (DUF202 family)